MLTTTSWEWYKTAGRIFVNLGDQDRDFGLIQYQQWLAETGRLEHRDYGNDDDLETSTCWYSPPAYWEDCPITTQEQHILEYLKHLGYDNIPCDSRG